MNPRRWPTPIGRRRVHGPGLLLSPASADDSGQETPAEAVMGL